MKSLNTIRKLHKYKMEELIKNLSVIELELDSVKNKLNELIETQNSEIENFSASDFSFTLESFISYIKEEQNNCNENIKRLEDSIEKTNTMIHDEFSELKKIEHIIMLKQKKEKEKINKMESKELDENTIVRHNRTFS